MLFLKQSTAITLMIGPFIDDTDGKTAETGLTEHPADILLSKNGGNFAAKNEGTNCAHQNLGWYTCPIDITDTNTLGRLQLHCHEAGFLPVFHEYMVLPANVYDSLISGSASDYLDVAVVQQADIDFGATQKASINTEVDNALNTAIPATNTATSVNDLLLDHIDPVLDNVHDTDLPAVQIEVNKIGTIVNTGGTATIGAIFGDFANNVLVTRIADLHTDVTDVHTDVGTAITNIGTVGGYVDTEVAAIKAVTDTLSLAAIADAVHDEITEGAITLRKATNIMLASLAGKSSGGATATIKFRDQADTTDRITATVDADGNRTAITNDGA